MLKKVLTCRREKVYTALNFLKDNNPEYADVIIDRNVNLPVDDILEEIMSTFEMQDPDDDNAASNSTYTPQTDLDEIPPDTVVMNSIGIVDIDGSNVQSSEQMQSAISSLQGTLVVPHGSVPVNEYDNPSLWYGVYPWLFPYGRSGPETNRKVKVGLRKFVKHVFNLADRSFALDISFPFHAFNVIQKRDVSYHTSLHVRRPAFSSTAVQIDALTPQAMEEALQCLQNKTPITNPGMRALVDSMTSAGKHVKGSSFQKAVYRKEILGLMIREGSPALWITLSPAGVHSPIFLQIAGHTVDLSDIPSHVERAKLVANDPLAAAKYFNEVIDAFTKFLLGYKNPKGGIFGHPSAFYGMTEEQGTGTLHNHMLVWLHNFKSASKLKTELQDETFRENLKNYLERIIKKGYLGDTDSVDENLDVSEVSCKHPVNPNDDDFEQKMKDDVNRLVKVANTHKCRATCHKYQHPNDCRFGYPHILVPVTIIEPHNIEQKRTHPMINNYNPIVMTCIRCNHDIKFIPSGKDGKNIAFYVTNYATKSQQSMHQMVPLIIAAKKRLDADPSNASKDAIKRSHDLLTKSMNRTITAVELSAAHVFHLIMYDSDNKTSHKFTSLNLHGALSWLRSEMKKYDDLSEAFSFDENVDKPGSKKNIKPKPDSTNDDDEDDESDDDEDQNSYTVSTGNEGLVFVNQMDDYVCRGEALKDLCLYEYCSRVYKSKVSEEELKKHTEKIDKKKTTTRYEQRHLFIPNHPQSETHWQKVRCAGNIMVPALSKLPPSSKENKDTYQKCMLLLFKPFANFEELFNGISWNETYDNFLQVTEHKQYIENIEEMHIGLEEKKNTENQENDNDIIDEVLDTAMDEDTNTLDNADEDIDPRTIEALDVIEKTHWLEESIRNHQSQQSVQSELENIDLLPAFNIWKMDLNQQNLDKVNNIERDDSELTQEPTSPLLATYDENVEVSVQESAVDTTNTIQSIEDVIVDVITEYNLNKKQKVAFEMAVKNVVKNYRNQETEQIIGYVGGPGGTGKSQVIKSIVELHKRLKMKNSLKLCANTGTAAKHIGGSTTTTLFGFGSQKNTAKLQNIFEKVSTIILDEVSMVGCRQLVKIANSLTRAKCADPNLPFGGVDIIFFGDFIQFSPVKDSPLYCGWNPKRNSRTPNQSSINKDLGMLLWKQINHIVFLDEQMRVQDTVYLAMLNRLREGKCTATDIAMINGRVVGQNIDITSISDAPIITPGNQLVMAINDLFVTRHSEHTDVYVSTAKDKLGKTGEVPKDIAVKYKNWACTATQGVPRELQLFIGMPVIVTTNIKTELGITNGTSGIVRHIHFNNNEVISEGTAIHHLKHHPDYIIVELNDVDVRTLDGLPPNHIPIAPVKKSFSVSVPGPKKKVSINRTHFPLVPRFSCTAHKSQGQTLSKAIVDLVPTHGNGRNIGIEFAYVPLSRVRRLDDLTVLRPFDPMVLKASVNDGCAAMMEEFKERDLGKNL